MYETYTRQALPSKKYRELLGSAICVFNSNNSFIIENILSLQTNDNYNWYDLIDNTSGQLTKHIKETITKASGTEIASLFNSVVEMRNRIIHSFLVTVSGEPILATKKKNHEQFIITEDYLNAFIKENDKLSDLLHNLRGY